VVKACVSYRDDLTLATQPVLPCTSARACRGARQRLSEHKRHSAAVPEARRHARLDPRHFIAIREPGNYSLCTFRLHLDCRTPRRTRKRAQPSSPFGPRPEMVRKPCSLQPAQPFQQLSVLSISGCEIRATLMDCVAYLG
jgi:hypothetical protein